MTIEFGPQESDGKIPVYFINTEDGAGVDSVDSVDSVEAPASVEINKLEKHPSLIRVSRDNKRAIDYVVSNGVVYYPEMIERGHTDEELDALVESGLLRREASTMFMGPDYFAPGDVVEDAGIKHYCPGWLEKIYNED